MVKSLLAVLLIFTLCSSESISCFALDVNDVEVSSEVNYEGQIDSSVEFGDGYVFEREEMLLEGQSIVMERTTYEDNRSVLRIKQDNEWTVREMTIDYEQLLFGLTYRNMSSNEKSARRLEERYVTSFRSRDYFGPISATVTILENVVGGIIDKVCLQVAPLGTVAGIVASLVTSEHTSKIEGYIDINRHFYGVYDVTGTFLGYYNVAYSIYTYGKYQGNYKLVDTEVGKYQSLSVG